MVCWTLVLRVFTGLTFIYLYFIAYPGHRPNLPWNELLDQLQWILQIFYFHKLNLCSQVQDCLNYRLPIGDHLHQNPTRFAEGKKHWDHTKIIHWWLLLKNFPVQFAYHKILEFSLTKWEIEYTVHENIMLVICSYTHCPVRKY